MKDTEKFSGVRLNKDEIDYIENHWDGKFSEFVHNAIKHNIKLTKNNKFKNIMQNSLYNVVMLGFGAFFIIYSLNVPNFVAFLIVFLLGIFFMSTSLVTIFIEVKNRWKTSS